MKPRLLTPAEIEAVSGGRSRGGSFTYVDASGGKGGDGINLLSGIQVTALNFGKTYSSNSTSAGGGGNGGTVVL